MAPARHRKGVNMVIQKLRREAREKFNTLETNVQDMYRREQCDMCGAHLTVRQMNRVILEGLPLVCLKDYKKMKGNMEELVCLFGQLKLL